jgi:trehalose 6-phosphate phosphatase
MTFLPPRFELHPAHDALFLDIDGTLLDVAPRPEAVRVSSGLWQDLRRLHQRLHGALALVSGRTLANIDELFFPLRLPAAGVHGAEWRLAPHAAPTQGRPLPDALVACVRQELMPLAGVFVEDKRYALAVHFREAPEKRPEVEAALQRLLAAQGGHLALLPGKMVLEIVQPAQSKGAAVEMFMTRRPFAWRRPVFLGDDAADEAAFGVCVRLGGRAAPVGESRSHAAAFRTAEDVRCWLRAQLR